MGVSRTALIINRPLSSVRQTDTQVVQTGTIMIHVHHSFVLPLCMLPFTLDIIVIIYLATLLTRIYCYVVFSYSI